MPQSRAQVPRLYIPRILPIICLLSLSGCGISSTPFYTIGVPYRAQVDARYCGAASVQMWIAYDGLSEPSQKEIFDWMNNYWPACGSNQLGVEAAVNAFTLTSDAYWDHVPIEEYELAAARQITSLDHGVPAIVVVDYNHTGILNGGSWHRQGDLYVWDTTLLHDPARKANREYPANDWIWEFCLDGCQQIISYSASAAWHYNKENFGDRIVVFDFDPHFDDAPPAY